MKPLYFASLFSGAGGLDLGLEEAGWQSVYASDIDSAAVKTLEANRGRALSGGCGSAFGNTFIEEADIREIRASELLAKAGILRGAVPLLAGGPPCQSWSSAGHQHGLKDPRGQLFSDFLRIAEGMDARWLLLENVRGLLTARGPDNKPGSALALIRRHLLKKGYQSSVSLLNAADYGVPQRRVRLFILAYREGDQPLFPVTSHVKGIEAENYNGKSPWVTLRDCLDALPRLEDEEIIRPSGKLAVELQGIAEGSGVKSPGKKERTRPGGHWGYKQGAFIADLKKPARTVTASSQQDWVRDPKLGLRKLCPRECAAIQTFPQDWEWCGNNSVKYRLIGNAVPPQLAKAVGESLSEVCPLSGFVAPETMRIEIDNLAPLPSQLQSAINYTIREERSNGASRRLAPAKKRSRIRLTDSFPELCDS